jgi:hypothetical protein
MIYYFVTARQSDSMQSYLASWGKALGGLIQIVTYESLLAGHRVSEHGASYIFTNLNRLRRMGPDACAAMGALHARLVQSCGAAKVLNDPIRSLTRYDLLRALHERGINQFNVYRLAEEVVPRRFPVFLRHETGTEFEQPPLRWNVPEYETAIRGIKWLRGSVAGMLAVEFCDTVDAYGVYRKYAAFVVGDRIIPRHIFFSRNWLVKFADLTEPARIEEELAFMESNQHADVLRECARLAGISYGRIDYSLLENRPQVWEINTNAMLASTVIPARLPAHLKFVEKIAEAFAAFDSAQPVSTV